MIAADGSRLLLIAKQPRWAWSVYALMVGSDLAHWLYYLTLLDTNNELDSEDSFGHISILQEISQYA